jgi:apolipoprotein D and lipocalin family protein
MRRYTRQCAVLLSVPVLSLVVAGCPAVDESLYPPLATVADVDIERYAGKWYEIAKYPVVFENGCVDVTAEYTLLEDGSVRVVNTCGSPDGSSREIVGSAVVTDPSTNAKLSVSFFGPLFGAPYWIIELGEDYHYAVIGDPSREFLWILSRTPALDDATLAEVLGRLPDYGYDPDGLVWTVQSEAMTP